MNHIKSANASVLEDEEGTKAALNTAIRKIYTKHLCQKRRRALRIRNCRRELSA